MLFTLFCIGSIIYMFQLNAYSAYVSTIFKDETQAKFATSLSDYYISKPKFSLSRHVHLQRLSWNTIKNLQPELFYAKIRFNHETFKLELRHNRNLISKDFSLEENVPDSQDLSKFERPSNEYYKKQVCYYSGHIEKKPFSRVALSICEGLKGFISFEEGTFFIEPMKQLGPNFLHLIYRSSAELNSTHNPKKGFKLTCSTGNYRRDEHFTTPSEIFDESGKPPERKWPNKVNTLKTNQSPVANIEVFLVIDKYMVEFHGNESVHNYVLTMMNMVSDMYKDPSLGVLLNIVVSKVLILHDDLPNLNISHNGDKTLFSFCEWQFLRELSNSNNNANSFGLKYDVALLLTRKDVCAHSDSPCGTIGLAYIGGMCTPNRKCGVVEDIGLNTAYTIAHELGHNLGMTHDGLDNSCKMESGGYPHIMASQWPTANQISMRWSACSQKNLIRFLSSYKSYCIRESTSENKISNYQLSGILPGKLYDADTQCKQQYGGVAKHCKHFKISGLATDTCKHLWCEIEEEEECVSKLDPAAKGTKCADGKWCMYGQCVNNTDIPDSVDGGWGPWKNWTSCSRSCGVGTSYMERLCNSPIPSNGGRYCEDEGRKYVTCNVEMCPEKSLDVRKMQCEQYNNQTLKYTPIHSETQPCALHCRPQTNSAHYSVKFQQKVIDGTPCRHGSTDICVDGKCEKLGCDLKLKSTLVKDICGVCGGKGEGCNLIEGEFTQPLGKGYVNAVDIPLGAKNVLVKEVKPCASFLALKSGRGSYHINGNWTIELPGRYNVNGTVVYYRRRGTQEFFFTDGPTKAEMHFMVLYQDFNFGVKYRYVLPINTTLLAKDTKEKKYKGSFGWMQGAWDMCSVVCGGGIMRREKPRCLHMYENKINIVNETLCSGAKMPPSPIKTCNEHDCPKMWFVTPWNTCSKTCGLGRRKRNVSCKAQQKDGSYIQHTECAVSEKPLSIQTCVEKSCYLSWKLSAWSKCRAKCGKYGLKYRSVTCPMENSCLETVKPSMTRSCKATPCEYSWILEPWTECSSSCGMGIQTRKRLCREEESFEIANGKCHEKRKPKMQRKCFKSFCKYYRQVLRSPSNRSPVSYSPINRISLLPPIRRHERAPRIKRKPNKKYLVYQKHPIRNNFVKFSAPHDYHCVKDQLNAMTCNRKIIMSRYANKRFCENPKDRRVCCASCKRHRSSLTFLPITPRKRNG